MLLVFAILWLLVGNEWAAGGGALLFGVHPVQVESVAWISEMKGVLFGFFSLLAVWQYLVYCSSSDGGSPTARRRAHYILGTAAFVLALLSKPSAVAVPLVCWVLSCWALRRPLRRSVTDLIPWMAAAVLCLLVARFAQPSDYMTPLWWRPFVAGDALAFYLSKLLLPLRLATHYGRIPEVVMAQTWGYLTWIVPCALAIFVWWHRKRWPLMVAAAGIFMAALLPVLGFVPFIFQNYSTVADRYLYLAMLGPALGVAWLLSRKQRKGVTGVYALALVMLGALSALQTSHWKNTFTLFEHTLQVNPQSWIAHDSLGAALAGQGKMALAFEHYRRALECNPNYPGVYYNLGTALAEQGKLPEAIERFRQALSIDPGSPNAHVNLANCLAAQGETAEAMAHYAEALRLMPGSVEAHNDLGLALARQHDYNTAIEHYMEALRLKPDDAEVHYNLGIALGNQGKVDEAIQHFRAALQSRPNYVEARHNIGIALMMQGKTAEAIDQWSQALRINPGYEPSRQALAQARQLQK